MPSLDLSSLPWILAFLVPGFVWARVHGYFQVVKPAEGESWLGVLTLSAINFAFWSWLAPYLIIQTSHALRTGTAPSVWTALLWTLPILIGPALFGIATGHAQQQGRLRRFVIERLGLTLLHPIETAWDFAFGETDLRWAVVTLKDGSVVEGVFADESLASSKPGERDLFLEAYYRRSDGGLVRQANQAGIWIAADTIKTVELKRPEIVDNTEIER